MLETLPSFRLILHWTTLISLDVLFPQQLQGDMLVRLQLLVNRGEVGFDTALTRRPRHTPAEQALFELSLVAVRRQGP